MLSVQSRFTPLPVRAMPLRHPLPGQVQAAMPRFGICVNKGTAVTNAIELLLRESLQKRMHIVAEMGRAGTAPFAQVLTDLLLGKKDGTHDFLRVVNTEDRADNLKRVTLISLLEAYQNGELTAEEKRRIVDALKQAKTKGFLQRVKPLIQDIIDIMEGKSGKDTADVHKARHEWQHALGMPHDHHHGHDHHH